MCNAPSGIRDMWYAISSPPVLKLSRSGEYIVLYLFGLKNWIRYSNRLENSVRSITVIHIHTNRKSNNIIAIKCYENLMCHQLTEEVRIAKWRSATVVKSYCFTNVNACKP